MPVRLLASLQPRTFITILVPTLFLFGCATPENSPSNASTIAGADGTSQNTVNRSGMPKWMQEALARESNTPFKPTRYSIDDIGVNLVLPGKPRGELQDTTTSKFLRIDIGAGEAMGCEVYYVDFDPAYAITRLADINLKETSEKIGKVSNKILYSTASGAYENRPYHALEWIANVGDGSNRKLALFKYRLAIIGDYGLACQHAEVGYQKTFESAFKYLVNNFEYEKSDISPYLTELASMSINNKVVGFYLENYFEDADGDTIVSAVSSMLIPSTNQIVTPIDKHNLTYSTPQGEIINSFKSSLQNGDVEYDLALDFDSDKDAWVVSGDFKGKSFEQVLQHDAYIDSSLGQRIVLKQIAQSDEANSGQVFYWDPDVNPAEVLSSTLNLSEKTGAERTANYKFGPIEVTGIVDSNGSMKQASVNAGSQLIVIDRLWLNRE